MDNREAGKRGYVYILRNSVFAGFLKIDKTSKDPKVRARELSAGTGVPAPYTVAWHELVSDCAHVERLIHHQLAPVRARRDREFFTVPLERAIAVAHAIAAPFACEGEESLPSIINNAAEAPRLPAEAPVAVPPSAKAANLRAAWSIAYPEGRGAQFLEKHTDFCRALAEGILGLGHAIEMSFDPMSIIFSDGPHGQRAFFGMTPQRLQVLLAPLTLAIPDIRDLSIPAAQIRDISAKKYKMGGLFRVERAQNLEMELALELARRAFDSTRTIKTWNLLGIRK